MAVRESMGGIVDRSQEHLGASDAVVVHARRRLLDAVQAFQQGADRQVWVAPSAMT
jgi:phthalate 4,5-dioxygenase